MKAPTLARRLLLVPVGLLAVFAGGAVARVQDQCGPFTDVSPALCPYVLEMYYLGITAGTSPTTYSPDSVVTRGQAAVFVSKGVNQAIARSSRRAALGQWWSGNLNWSAGLGVTPVGSEPRSVAADGSDVWVANVAANTVSRVRASDGKLLETWTEATYAFGVLVAMGRVFAVGYTSPGALYMIDPSQPAGPVTTVTSKLGVDPISLAFDGSRIWTVVSGSGSGGSISIVTPGPTVPWSVTTIQPGLVFPTAIAFDGTNMWVLDRDGDALYRLDQAGAVTLTVPIPGSPAGPEYLAFDGANLWTTNRRADSVSVVRASTGEILTTLTGNGLDHPRGIAFDGERILVTNLNSVSLWRAADLAPLGTFGSGADSFPFGACSDGLNFWVTLSGPDQLARF